MKNLVSQKNLFMSVKEAEKVLSAVPESEQHYRLLLLLVAHGCRPCEAVRLHLSDFVSDDFTRFYVENSKVVRKGQSPRRDLKIVPSWLGQFIKEYVTDRYGWGELRGGYLFPSSVQAGYRHMTPESLLTWFGKLRKRLGLCEVVAWKKSAIHARIAQHRISVYSFRRLFATELAFAGADQRVIAALMGHKDTSITSQYQDKARLLERAPLELAKMPRLFGNGQLRLSAFQ